MFPWYIKCNGQLPAVGFRTYIDGAIFLSTSFSWSFQVLSQGGLVQQQPCQQSASAVIENLWAQTPNGWIHDKADQLFKADVTIQGHDWRDQLKAEWNFLETESCWRSLGPQLGLKWDQFEPEPRSGSFQPASDAGWIGRAQADLKGWDQESLVCAQPKWAHSHDRKGSGRDEGQHQEAVTHDQNGQQRYSLADSSARSIYHQSNWKRTFVLSVSRIWSWESTWISDLITWHILEAD